MHRNRTLTSAAAALLTMIAGVGGSPAAAEEQRSAAGAAEPALQTIALTTARKAADMSGCNACSEVCVRGQAKHGGKQLGSV